VDVEVAIRQLHRSYLCSQRYLAQVLGGCADTELSDIIAIVEAATYHFAITLKCRSPLSQKGQWHSTLLVIIDLYGIPAGKSSLLCSTPSMYYARFGWWAKQCN
jgi:hypothetical protein